jgi:hypothetical protein
MSDREEYNTRNKKRDADRYNKASQRWHRKLVRTVLEANFIIQFMLVVCTGLLAYIAWVTDHTLDNTLVAANRAWIAPRVIQITGKVEVGKWLETRVVFDNIGKEPALSLLSSAPNSGYFPVAPNKQIEREWDIKNIPPNKTCETINTEASGGLTIYPVGIIQTVQEMSIISFGDSTGLTNEVFAGKNVFWTQGCFAYRTFNKIRYSAFCFIWQPIPGITPDKWIFKYCPTGNYAS